MSFFIVFFFNDTATTEIYTLSLHDALPILEEALYKDFDDDVKEYQSGHSNDVAEQVAGQCIQCGSFDIRYKTQNSYYARTAACMHGYHAGHDVVKQDILVRYVECQVCRYQEHISNTTIGAQYIECYGFN